MEELTNDKDRKVDSGGYREGDGYGSKEKLQERGEKERFHGCTLYEQSNEAIQFKPAKKN